MIIAKNKSFFAGLIITVALLAVFLILPPSTQIYKNERVYLSDMDQCFQDGQIPCRWVADVGRLYGYPLFNYFAPLPYYFGEIFFRLTGDLVFSIKITFAVSFLGSFIFMYLLARKFIREIQGVVLAVIFAALPYYVANFYIAGGVSKMWELMLLPAIFWSIFKLAEKTSIRKMLLLAILVAAALLSHNLSTVLLLPVVLGWIILLFLHNKLKNFLLVAGFATTLAILLSSFFSLPMIFEKNLVRGDYLPVYAKEYPKNLVAGRYEILTGDSLVYDFKQASNWISFKTETKTHTIIRIPQHYFPGWKIFIDGKETKIDYKSNNLGLMTIILGKGNHQVLARFFDTPARTVANSLSIVGVGIGIILFLISFKNVRGWISYYRKGIS